MADREQAAKWFEERLHAGLLPGTRCMYEAALVALREPERRRGQLVSTGIDEMYAEFGDCTECGGDNYIKANFCNWCGADLRKGEKDNDSNAR